MSDWSELTAAVVDVVRGTKSYLESRPARAAHREVDTHFRYLAEQATHWYESVTGVEVLYQARRLPVEVSPEDQPVYGMLVNRLAFTRAQIGKLGEYYDYIQVEPIFAEIGRLVQDFLTAGPHGPGGGRPPRPSRPDTTGPHGPGGGPPPKPRKPPERER